METREVSLYDGSDGTVERAAAIYRREEGRGTDIAGSNRKYRRGGRVRNGSSSEDATAWW